MTTAAQRERTQLRTKLYTGCMIPGSHGRGGARIPESSRDAARPGLVQLWPAYLDKERAAAKPTLTLVGVKAMLEEEQTPAFKAFAPRRLSGGEVAVIRAWYEKAQQQEKKDLGDAVAAAQGNIMGQAAANHDEVMEKLRGHNEILQRLDNQTKSGSQLQREATKRKQEELRDKYQAVLQSVGRALPEEPLQPLAEYRNRLRDPVLRTALAEKAAAANAQPGADGEAAGESEAPPQRSRSMSPFTLPDSPLAKAEMRKRRQEDMASMAAAGLECERKFLRLCGREDASTATTPSEAGSAGVTPSSDGSQMGEDFCEACQGPCKEGSMCPPSSKMGSSDGSDFEPFPGGEVAPTPPPMKRLRHFASGLLCI
jgi:hypothetical protein